MHRRRERTEVCRLFATAECIAFHIRNALGTVAGANFKGHNTTLPTISCYMLKLLLQRFCKPLYPKRIDIYLQSPAQGIGRPGSAQHNSSRCMVG